MNTASPSIAQQTSTDEAGNLGLATAQSTMLRRTFNLSLSRRSDAKSWRVLGEAIAKVLEQRKTERTGVSWFSETDAKLNTEFAELLEGRTRSRSLSYYRQAARGIYQSAKVWGESLDEADMAYWRHSALVWLTLWHLADIPQMSAEQATECFECVLNRKDAPAPRMRTADDASENRDTLRQHG